MNKLNIGYDDLLDIGEPTVSIAGYEVSTYGKFYFNCFPALDDSLHYYDEGHLNQLGVERFNAFFCDSILLPSMLNLCLQ